MPTGLIEINPGFISCYRFSSASTSLEIIQTQKIKINKKLTNSRDFAEFVEMAGQIDRCILKLRELGCDLVRIISVGFFNPLLIAKLKESFDISYLDNNLWKYFISRKIKDKTLCLWFEKGYAKAGWIKNETVFVNDLYIGDSKIKKNTIIGPLNENANKLALYDFPENIEYIKIGGMFDIESEEFISVVILNISKMFPYSKISYDLKSFIEIVTGKVVK